MIEGMEILRPEAPYRWRPPSRIIDQRRPWVRFISSGREATVKHSVAVVPGDGIGKEVVPEALRVLERAGETGGFEFISRGWA